MGFKVLIIAAGIWGVVLPPQSGKSVGHHFRKSPCHAFITDRADTSRHSSERVSDDAKIRDGYSGDPKPKP